MVIDSSQADALRRGVEKHDVVFAVTHNYTGYPMVKEPDLRSYLDAVYRVTVQYHRVAIQSLATRRIERFFVEARLPKRTGWSKVARIALRKLDMLDYAEVLTDLASPPGNRLEALKGNLMGFHSIRINDQWRVVFRWTASGPADVDILDYH